MKNIRAIFVSIIIIFSFARPQGTVIVLNGTSTAGKSSIIKQIHPSVVRMAIDSFIPEEWAKLVEERTGQETDPDDVDDAIEEAFSKDEIKRIQEQLIGKMYKTIRNIASEGKDIIIDTVIYTDEDMKAVIKNLKGVPVAFVLAYCPFSILFERAKARKQVEGEDMLQSQPLYGFGEIYKRRLSTNEIVLETISRRELDQAFNESRFDISEHGITPKKFQQILRSTRKNLGLTRKNSSAEITPKFTYDLIVNTGKYSSKQCALQVESFLRDGQPLKAIRKNEVKLAEQQKFFWQKFLDLVLGRRK